MKRQTDIHSICRYNPANSITGYKVMYQSSATQKKNIRYFNTRYSFTLPTVKNTFYQVKIYPYLTLNNKRFVSPTPATRYIAKGVILQKAGNTSTTMSVKWKKVSGCKQLLCLHSVSGKQFPQKGNHYHFKYLYINQYEKEYQIPHQCYCQ